LRADCDFLSEIARFSFSTDGRTFTPIGEPFTMVFQLATFQGVRYALFAFNAQGRGGAADFDSFDVRQPDPRGLMRPIPYGARVALAASGRDFTLTVDGARAFDVIDRELGRVALRAKRSFVSVAADGRVTLRRGAPRDAETFQWIETPTGELVLMSLRTHRFLRIDPESRAVVADSPGPLPDGSDGVRFTVSRTR
jgi:hypothetical protein